MNVFIFARLHAAPGRREALRAAMHRVQGPTRAEPACLAYGAFPSLRDPDEFYIHSRWTDRRAFEAHATEQIW
ncbi:MAG TPA: antibiotic biosynthesis monooxygenase [Steroidobacteraceae bacterium]|nr:antibiotic biosynthesis monooxygenase [Steroidobacteraceae bacterium]